MADAPPTIPPASGGRGRAGAWAAWAYLAVTLACAGTGGAATWRIARLERSVRFLAGQLEGEAQTYAATLQTRYADGEMASFQERRVLIEAASTWWQIRLACLMVWVLATFAFYIQRSISTLAEEIA